MLIPPSNTLIVYSTVAGSVSISALFIAGYIPGILWGLGIMIVASLMAKKLKYKSEDSISTGYRNDKNSFRCSTEFITSYNSNQWEF